jgi:transposase-like protein
MQIYRKRITKEQKFNILSDHYEKGIPISELARLHGITPVTLYQWKRLMGDEKENTSEINLDELKAELEKLRSENKKLTKALGELTLDNQCLKDVTAFLKKKYHNHLLEQQKNSSKKKG